MIWFLGVAEMLVALLILTGAAAKARGGGRDGP